MELHYTSENLPVFKTNIKKTSVLFITKDCYVIIKIWFLHMKEIPLQTRDVVDEFEFYHEFQFVDITDGKESNPDSPMFYACSTTLEPWLY